ncbi:MAG: HAMP domain-containing protein [Bdellovibrio sp.]|nr:HAMP domain-containing protein [Bdellovibrio sp.]
MHLNSLAIRTLLKMSIRITLIILLVVVGSYYHLKMNIETQTKQTLASYITEREARERIVFEEAQQNHEILKNEFLRLYHIYLYDATTEKRFWSLTEKFPDGLIRNKMKSFDGKSTPGIFIGKNTVINRKLMAKILASYETSLRMGPAYHARFQDTYFTFPQNAIVLYWPEEPLWVQKATSSLFIPQEEYASVSQPAQNPSRSTKWTGLFFDKVSKIWMVTGSTPVYSKDEFLGSVHHDVLVTELIQRTLNNNLKGAKNYILRRDGRLIAHPNHLEKIEENNGLFSVELSNDPILTSQFKTIQAMSLGSVASDTNDNYLAVAEIPGPGWYVVAEYPKAIIKKAAAENVGFLFGAGLFSLLLELFVLFFVLRREVSKPLLSLIRETKEITQGNYKISVQNISPRKNEIGILASSFNEMIRALNQRDIMIARHNENLEGLIEERTKELDNQKTINIQASKLSSLGEMASGIAHEVNTPLGTSKLLTSQAQTNIKDPMPDLDALEQTLGQIDNTVDRIHKTVKGLKTFARNATEDPLEKCEVQALIEDTIVLCQERCKLHGIALKVFAPTLPVFISCRPTQLCQVLLNLISNAHDAVENCAEKWIEIHVIEETLKLQIKVIDSGAGVPVELKEKVFNPFFTTKGAGKGTGLGLSISHGIIKSLSGVLKISDDSPNSCFVIELPKPKDKAA